MKKNGETTFKWDRKLKKHVEIPLEEHPLFNPAMRGAPSLFVGFNYRELMELARQTHIVLLAVLAELYRLHFRSWNRKEPLVFNCSRLGFDRWTVMRALKSLEKAGWVSLQTSRGHCPRVTLRKGFQLPK